MGNFAVSRPVSVLMLTLVMILFGLAAYLSLPSDLFPEISQPGLVVRTAYEGAASSEIEQNVTRRLEEKLGAVRGLSGLRSTSGNEQSEVFLTFGWGTDMDLAAMDVRAKLDEVRDDLPEEAEDPVVLRTSAGSAAVMVLSIAPNPASTRPTAAEDVRELVEQTIKPRLERIGGVAAVSVVGGVEYEVRVKVRPERLVAHNIAITDVQDALERENLSQRGGKLRDANRQFLIRTVGSLDLESLGDLIVSRPGEKIVRLSEVAQVEGRQQEPSAVARPAESLARLATGGQSQPSVEVAILKKGGGNSVAICEGVRRMREAILYDLARPITEPPAGTDAETLALLANQPDAPGAQALQAYIDQHAPLQIVVSYDESTFISESLEMVRSNGLQGLILASVILLVFLRRLQSTFIVALSMPVSVIATFSLFYAGGISINIFSMAGLTLAVGMVVDNAIVVTEAIFHKLGHERRVKKAVTDAVQEIGPAIWASTLTTMAVFLPIVFVPGIAGQIFRDLSWVITYTLVFSIVVAFTLIPMLTLQVMNVKIGLLETLNRGIELLLWPLTRAVQPVTKLYASVLTLFTGTLPARLALITIMAALFVASVFLLPPAEFFPETKVESYELSVRPRVGQTLESVDEAAGEIETMLADTPEIVRYNVSVTPRVIRFIASFDKQAVMDGRIRPLAALAPVLRGVGDSPRLHDAVLDYSLRSLNPLTSLLGTGEGDILLQARGPDLDTLEQILTGSEGEGGLLGELRAQQQTLGIATIGRTASRVPEWVLKIRRTQAADLGFTLEDIADQVEAAVAGVRATDLTIRETSYDLVVAMSGKPTSQKQLLDLDLVPPPGSGTTRSVKLREVVELLPLAGHETIRRDERERVLTVPIFVDKNVATLGEVVNRLRQPGGPVDRAETAVRGAGYRITLGGASEAMDESLGYLGLAFAVAVLLVYMVMASQFESLIHPFTIMFSVPLSLIGAVAGLRLSGDPLSLTAMIGIIMLAGIVVNNAIILIDYINILRARGLTRNAAILEAGLTRLRPILMTTLTTVLGMGPLALGYGTGAELYKPLAVVVVAGLSLSTLLTLVFIPAVYCFADDVTDLVGFARFRLGMLFAKQG